MSIGDEGPGGRRAADDRLDRLAGAVVAALDLADELALRDIGIALESARLALEERGVRVAAPRRPPYAPGDLDQAPSESSSSIAATAFRVSCTR